LRRFLVSFAPSVVAVPPLAIICKLNARNGSLFVLYVELSSVIARASIVKSHGEILKWGRGSIAHTFLVAALAAS
jgi:hypothetical protein